jgi:hypothetical protein
VATSPPPSSPPWTLCVSPFARCSARTKHSPSTRHFAHLGFTLTTSLRDRSRRNDHPVRFAHVV